MHELEAKVGNKQALVLLPRVGAKRQGVVGLYQPGPVGEQSPRLPVRFMGIDRNAIASYLISLYCSLAMQTDDVEAGKFNDYPDTDPCAAAIGDSATLKNS